MAPVLAGPSASGIFFSARVSGSSSKTCGRKREGKPLQRYRQAYLSFFFYNIVSFPKTFSFPIVNLPKSLIHLDKSNYHFPNFTRRHSKRLTFIAIVFHIRNFLSSISSKEMKRNSDIKFDLILFPGYVERMARTEKMAFEKDNPRSNIWHWSEETSTTTYRNQYRNRSEECHCRYRNWNWHSSKTATNRRHTAPRSFGEMRRSKDDPTNLYAFWIGFSKYLNNFFYKAKKEYKKSTRTDM